MNLLIIGIIVVLLITIIGIGIGCVKKTPITPLFFILGVIALAIGVYLFPATMWRVFSITFLLSGLLLELVAIVMTIKNVKK